MKVGLDDRVEPLLKRIATEPKCTDQVVGESDAQRINRAMRKHDCADCDGNDTTQGHIEPTADCGGERITLGDSGKQQCACTG